jgi:hypothetical protein
MTLTRITRAEAWLAGGTHGQREKSATHRGQSVAAFARDAVLAADWFSPVDSVVMRLSKVLAESYGKTTAASLTRSLSHIALAAVAAAEADRAKSVAFAVIDLVREKDGRRGYMAGCSRDVTEIVEGWTIERVSSVNVSFLIRLVRGVAARERLPGFDQSFMPAPDSEAFAVIVKPFIDAQLPDLIEEHAMSRVETMARRAGALARRIAMGGATEIGQRRQPRKAA